MFIFILYAVLVWWGAYHWRRHALGFAVVGTGGLILFATAWFHTKVGEWTEGRIYVPVLQSILYPYIALVLLVGLCFAFAPTHTGGRLVRTHKRCKGCGYDLRGLPDSQTVCPECGVRFVGTPRRRCLHCGQDLTGTSVSVRECPNCGKHPRIMNAPDSQRPAPPPRKMGPVATFKPLTKEGAKGSEGGEHSPPQQAEADPDQQHREGERPEQHPANGAQL